MKNLLNLTESEKSRILNLHKSAIKKEFLFEQRMDAEGKNVEMYNAPDDKDYDYKKEGDKYFFKLKANPKSKEAKAYLAQKKFINWTEAKGEGLKSIKKLQFQAVAPPPPNTDGSDETFEPPVQTTNTATTPTTSNTGNNTPVKYPWIGADGKSSLENLQKAKTADPNFNNWLGELKKLSRQQLTKVQEDLYSFKKEISQSGIDVQSDQSYLVANQAINDAINLIGKTTPSTSTTSNTVNNAPVKYPWIGADGRSSLASLQKAKTADPNFNNWLGELKKLSPPQLIKVKLDLSKFKEQISKSGIDVKSDQSYLVAYQAIADAQKFVGKQPTI